MNNKMKEYVLNNWQKYNLTDTKEEFVALLNILETTNETIDDIHNVVINGGYIGISVNDVWNDEREVVDSLFYFSAFYTLDKFKELLYEELSFCKDNEEEEYFIETYIRENNNDVEIFETSDGYVITTHC